MQRVAIVGVAQTKLEPEKKAQTFADLIYEVSLKALNDAGIAMDQLDNIVTASNDFLDGRTISSMSVGDAAGAAFGGGKNISTVEGDGAFAAIYGLSRILSGCYSSTLVVAHSKPSEGDYHLISNACFDPIFERSLGLDWISAAALQARLYMDYSGFNSQGLAGIVARNRNHGACNPNAMLRQPSAVQDIFNSPFAASPIKQSDIAPLSDGAAALILADENAAKKCRKKPIWVEGVACSADPAMTDRNLWESPALNRAAKKAYEMAGVTHPGKEIGLAEISEDFSYQEPMWIKELGLDDLPKNRTNPSGGCLCGHAPIAAGLVRMIEATLQLRKEAANQVVNPKKAVAHGQNGICGQSHAVWVLGD